MEKKKPLVSVVIPVYNYEKYVEKCLHSVVNQTYKNLEIIVIDDGSTDSSPQIIDKMASEDSRIVVKHKENGGIGSALSYALELVHGKYVAFLDSDDYMELNAYQVLVDAAEECDVDVVEFGTTYYDLKGNKLYDVTASPEVIIGNENIMYDYICVDTVSPLSRKFVKSEMVKKLVMLHYSAGIDEIISIQIMTRAQKLMKIAGCYYNVLGEPNKDSVGLRAIKGENIEKQLQMHQEIIEYLKVHNDKFVTDYVVRYLCFLRGRFAIVYKRKLPLECMITKTYREYWNWYRNHKTIKKHTWMMRFSLMLFCFSPQIYMKAISLMK